MALSAQGNDPWRAAATTTTTTTTTTTAPPSTSSASISGGMGQSKVLGANNINERTSLLGEMEGTSFRSTDRTGSWLARASFTSTDSEYDEAFDRMLEVNTRASLRGISSVEAHELLEDIREKPFDFWTEAKLLLDVALPTMVVQFSITFIFPQTASSLGLNLGTVELAGFSLASLTGNLVCLSVMLGTLTATETLQPRAFGMAKYEEVGRIAVRAVLACVLVLLPPLILILMFMDKIMVALGQDPVTAGLSIRWIRIYALGVPPTLLFRVLQRFLAAQGIVMPMVYSSLLGCLVFHPLFLRCFLPAFGFEGSGLAVICSQTVMMMIAFIIVSYQRPYHPRTWPGLSPEFVMEALKIKPLYRFLSLSFGGVLSLSEWWFWEVVCFMAGRFSVVSFCVHSIAYSITPIFLMIPLGFGIGLNVRIGTILANDVQRAQTVAKYGVATAVVLITSMSLTLYLFRDFVMGLYTQDKDVLEGCERIWWKLCLHTWCLSMHGINGAILRALGLQWKMAGILVTFLWFVTLPILWWKAVRQGGGVDAIWTVLPLSYIGLNATLMSVYVTTDWSAVSASIRERARRSILLGDAPDEATFFVCEKRGSIYAKELKS